jgi:hypothetical protein
VNLEALHNILESKFETCSFNTYIKNNVIDVIYYDVIERDIEIK